MTYGKEYPMRLKQSLFVISCAGLLAGCGATVPNELAEARRAFLRVNAGPAVDLAPAELNDAKEALVQAETSFEKDAESYRTRDLSYVAQRKAEMAEAQASIVTEQTRKTGSDKAFGEMQGELLRKKTEDLNAMRTELAVSEESGQAAEAQVSVEQKGRIEAESKATRQSEMLRETSRDLSQTKTALAVSERSGLAASDQLAGEQKARVEAQQKMVEAQTALANLASREDERGTVITLSGSLLFRSGEAFLMPGATSQLDRVAEALSASGPRNVAIEGHTDSQGSDQQNLRLSERRAEAVRDHLVRRGYDASLISVLGVGEANPIAGNDTAEGRANNRRVEIILEREAQK
jgi:outer membrane protein OmpA-like peptidoglycan-associated protein